MTENNPLSMTIARQALINSGWITAVFLVIFAVAAILDLIGSDVHVVNLLEVVLKGIKDYPSQITAALIVAPTLPLAWQLRSK